jgi:hypothetical protein
MSQHDHFDERGHILVKLYKKAGSDIQYWETWNTDDKTAVVHFGKLGEFGTVEDIAMSSHQALKSTLHELIRNKQQEGYAEIPLSQQYTLTLSFTLETWGTPEDLERREQIRDILTEHLGWTGNGRCDDADIGSGEITLFADVIDPYLALETIPNAFKENNVHEQYMAAITLGDSTIAENIKRKSE